MTRQPTAIAYTRGQEKYGRFILKKVREAIETALLTEDEDNPSDSLLDLYDEEFFWVRYIDHMVEQRDYLHEKFDVPY